VRFKFVATATPSPNRFKELIHYAGFLGIMDTGQALTRFFQRDSQKAGNLTLYPHKAQEFFSGSTPGRSSCSALATSDSATTAMSLPEIEVVYHEVAVDHSTRRRGSGRPGELFRNSALGVSEAAREKRNTMPAARGEGLRDRRRGAG
jgi:hypothetical protein